MAVAPPRTRHLNVAVLADLHLGSSRSKAKEVLAYLESITPDTLILAGDFIDLAKVQQGKLKQDHLDVILKVLDFAQEGSKVYYLTGNHDSRLRKFGNLALGNLHIREELQLQFNGHKHYFFHGDCLDAAVKYKLSTDQMSGVWGFLKPTLRKLVDLRNFAAIAFRKMLGRQKWSLAAELKTNPQGAEAYVKLFERAASNLAEAKGCDHVICAHIHQAKIERLKLNGETVRYLNAGDWVDSLTALEYRFGKWKLYQYDTDDFPAPRKLLRIPLSTPNDGSRRLEEELMRTLVNA